MLFVYVEGYHDSPTFTRKEAFRVNSSTRQKWLRRKRRIEKRLRVRKFRARSRPMSKWSIEEEKLLQKMPRDLEELIQ